VAKDDLPTNIRLFLSRFVDEVKYIGTNKVYKKLRLVIQVYGDKEKSIVLTQSLTIQRVSQRIQLSIKAMFLERRLLLYDIT